MPEVIADTSVIQYLYQSAHFSILPILYSSVVVPLAVVNELEEGRNIGISLPNIEDSDWIQVVRLHPQNLVAQISGLGQGEREVISVAVGSPSSLALLDDGLARQYAKDLKVNVTGTLGILLKAKQAGLVQTVIPALERLNDLGFRASHSTLLTVLKMAGEVDR